MSWLDGTTTSVVTALVVTVCCVVYLIDTLSYRHHAAARLWAVSFSAGVLTAFAYMVWAFEPDAWMAVAAGNASFVGSIGLLWLGCRRFQRPALGWAAWACAAAVVATFAAALLPGPDGGDWAGAGVMFGSMAVMAGLACLEIRRWYLRRARTASAMSAVMGAVSLYYTVRTVLFVQQGASPFFLEWFGTPTTSLVTIVLTVVAVTTMILLRVHDQADAGERQTASLVVDADGYLDRSSFVYLLRSQVARADLHRAPVSVVVLELADLAQVAAAFGASASRRISTRLRRCVLELAPTTARLGIDGEARTLLLLPGASETEARKVAQRLVQLASERLHASLEATVVPELGAGVATRTQGTPVTGAHLVEAAVASAGAAVTTADDVVVAADLSAGGQPVADPTDGLDPAR